MIFPRITSLRQGSGWQARKTRKAHGEFLAAYRAKRHQPSTRLIANGASESAAIKPQTLILTADFADAIWIKPKAQMIDGSNNTRRIAACGLGFRICVNLRHLRLKFWMLGMLRPMPWNVAALERSDNVVSSDHAFAMLKRGYIPIVAALVAQRRPWRSQASLVASQARLSAKRSTVASASVSALTAPGSRASATFQ